VFKQTYGLVTMGGMHQQRLS